jgi:hypothetical protein
LPDGGENSRPDPTRADQLAPGDQWFEHHTLLTMIEGCPAPLSNQVRLRVRRADGVERMSGHRRAAAAKPNGVSSLQAGQEG